MNWARLGVWERLLDLARERFGAALGMAFLDGTSVRAPADCPDWAYANRNIVEQMWARLKKWRAVAIRYKKTAASFLGVLCLAATKLWIRG